ncbi:hypothetical protein Q7C36_009832 [Tachysurus vachellii]|uniref:CCHC-type domain-containing protein n=1 Tax=Tachysurus vachellii TaxID=175792 RepID=A0AA88N617_TACVA|nr:hypothetical protein Q7C36_009832 [Tachysurus vachellii]
MESDYDTWLSNVEFHLTDATLSARHIVRKIVESLSPPATNVVKNLGPNATPRDYITFAKFLNTNQNTGEKPSSYLQRLQIVLNKVISRGGIVASDLERQLIKQFCRGCWDNSLITNLQLEQKKHNPPRFQNSYFCYYTQSGKTTHPAKVASLKASLSGNSNQTPTKKARPKAKVSTEENTLCSGDLKLTKKPRPGYCFKCGEDGHIASSCSNEPNYDLVEIKRNQFKQKQKAWEKQNKHDLN